MSGRGRGTGPGGRCASHVAVLVAVALAVALVASGCVARQEPPADKAGPQPTTRRLTAGLGEEVDLFGVKVTVFEVDPWTLAKGFPRVVATMRSDNTNRVSTPNPDVELMCAESPTGGDWYRESTWETNGLVPTDTVTEGQLVLGFPAKPGAAKYAVAACTDAQLRITATRPVDRSRIVVTVKVDQQVIDQALDAV